MTTRTFLRPTAFVDSPFGHDGKVERLAGGLCWFSAVEAEVYAMSSFFTAFVVWAIFKWERIEDDGAANRWLIFIAYMVGLSIGVHLLNLVTLPALALVYYFKKYKPTFWGGVAAMAVGGTPPWSLPTASPSL